MSSPWSVYVLISATGRRTYVGITVDPDRRTAQHNGELSGGAKATRAGRPWTIAALYGPYRSRAEAQRAEYALKRRRGRQRLVWKAPAPISDSG